MPGPSLDLEQPNATGTLDRLTTNFGISLIAVFPTFLTCIAMPWRLSPLLTRDDPEGRMGVLLAPGAFFPLSLLVSLLASALVTTPELLNSNGAYLGPGLALSLQSALAEGDVWKIIAIILPIYGFAVLIGALGSFLKPWTRQDWTLRVSLRAVLYVTATLVSWIILLSAGIDLFRVSTGNNKFGLFLYAISPIPTIGLAFWMYLCFFRHGGAVSWVRSSLLSLGMIVLTFAVVGGIDLLIRSTNAS